VKRPVVAIHQPNFLPWLGWFAKAAQADVLVLLDDVQLERAGPTQRVRIKSREGPRELTVPVRRGHDVRIDAAEIAHDGKWDVHAARVLENAYRATPGWPRHGAAIVAAMTSREPRLAPFNERLITYLLGAFAIGTRVVRASELGPREAHGSDGNLEICRRLGASTYLSGQGARKYNDPAPFAAAGIDLAYSVFEHPAYTQPHGAFVPGLSAVDVLFSAPDEAAALLRSGIRAPSAA
jgi:WbqC-like protein family